MDPLHWLEVNKIANYAYQLPSYATYLKLIYKDLLASVGLLKTPCNERTKNSTYKMKKNVYAETDLNGESEYLDTGYSDDTGVDLDPYCGGYNLILTSRYMMVCYVYI
jgi:hypothetical protein